MWMDLETVKQSEGSQKEKNKYILTHTCGTQKNGIDELICKAKIDTEVEKEDKHKNTKGEVEVGWIGTLGLAYIHYYA